MKFVVDVPLGGLAKWLRFCGFDTISRSLSPSDPGSLPPPVSDTYILTGQMAWQRFPREDLLILTATTPETQLQEVLSRLGLSRRDLDPMSRCVRCNELLVSRPRDQVQSLVPEHVFYTQKEFYECPRCHRLYWPGSHLAAINRKLTQALSPKKGRPASRPTPWERRGL